MNTETIIIEEIESNEGLYLLYNSHISEFTLMVSLTYVEPNAEDKLLLEKIINQFLHINEGKLDLIVDFNYLPFFAFFLWEKLDKETYKKVYTNADRLLKSYIEDILKRVSFSYVDIYNHRDFHLLLDSLISEIEKDNYSQFDCIIDYLHKGLSKFTNNLSFPKIVKKYFFLKDSPDSEYIFSRHTNDYDKFLSPFITSTLKIEFSKMTTVQEVIKHISKIDTDIFYGSYEELLDERIFELQKNELDSTENENTLIRILEKTYSGAVSTYIEEKLKKVARGLKRQYHLLGKYGKNHFLLNTKEEYEYEHNEETYGLKTIDIKSKNFEVFRFFERNNETYGSREVDVKLSCYKEALESLDIPLSELTFNPLRKSIDFEYNGERNILCLNTLDGVLNPINGLHLSNFDNFIKAYTKIGIYKFTWTMALGNEGSSREVNHELPCKIDKDGQPWYDGSGGNYKTQESTKITKEGTFVVSSAGNYYYEQLYEKTLHSDDDGDYDTWNYEPGKKIILTKRDLFLKLRKLFSTFQEEGKTLPITFRTGSGGYFPYLNLNDRFHDEKLNYVLFSKNYYE